MSSPAGELGTPPGTLRAPRVMVVSRCASAFGASQGGVDLTARRHASLLSHHGVEVVFVGTTPLVEEGVTTVGVNAIDPLPLHPKGTLANAIVYLGNEACHVLQAALAGAKVQRRAPVDLTISHSSLTTMLLKVLSGHRPIVHYTHDGLYAPPGSGEGNRSLTRYVVNNLLEKIALRMADQVICASDRIAAQANSVGIASDKLNVMYALILRGSAEPSAEDETTAASLAGSRPFLLSVGQQTGRKRFDLVIEALVGLPEELQLLLVGDGPMNARYRQLAESFGVSERVVFLTEVPNRALVQLYQHCAIYILASENEGFPATVIEALTLGRPVILACPTPLQLPTPPPGGHLLILPTLSVEALRGAIRQVMHHETDPVKLRDEIRRWAEQIFPSEEDILTKYRQIFEAFMPVGPAT